LFAALLAAITVLIPAPLPISKGYCRNKLGTNHNSPSGTYMSYPASAKSNVPRNLT
jgi:hypothetical protein